VGEDPDRQGLRRTPLRMARALDYLTRGYREDPAQVVGEALFEVANQEMVIVRNIELYSLCEHHMLPFFGKAHVGYIPDGKVVGLSKIARLVEVFSRRLQVQERLTQQIADSIMELIRPLGVAVVVEAHHMCMMMRGVEKQSSTTLTSAMLGTFRTNPSTRAEFLNLIRGVHRPIM
jgi:GTP cyclohydrolase I